MMLRVICQKFCATRSGPTYSNFCSGKSAAVSTALTPGRAAAFEVSIDRMRAWAWGERRMRPTNMPGIARSDPYNARPVTLGTPSGRTGRVPTHLSGRAVAFAGTSCMAASSGRGSRLPGLTVARLMRKCKPPPTGRAFSVSVPPELGVASRPDHLRKLLAMLAYTAPTTIEEAVRALAGASGVVKVLSGGTDLLAQLRAGRAKPHLIVDIKRIPDISGIRERDGAFV